MQDWLSPTSLRLGKASKLALLSFYVRLHLAQFLVAFVAQLGVALGGDEEFFGLGGEGLHQRVVAHLAHNEVAELAPVGWLTNHISLVV